MINTLEPIRENKREGCPSAVQYVFKPLIGSFFQTKQTNQIEYNAGIAFDTCTTLGTCLPNREQVAVDNTTLRLEGTTVLLNSAIVDGEMHKIAKRPDRISLANCMANDVVCGILG